MKRSIMACLVIASILMILDAMSYGGEIKNKIEGFGNMKWGISPKLAKNLYKDFASCDNIVGKVKQYYRIKENYTLGEVKFEKVTYYFFDNKFYKVEAKTETELDEEMLSLQNTIRSEYNSSIAENRKMNLPDKVIQLMVLNDLYKDIFKRAAEDIVYKYGECNIDKKDIGIDCEWTISDSRIKLIYRDCFNNVKCFVGVEIINMTEKNKQLGF